MSEVQRLLAGRWLDAVATLLGEDVPAGKLAAVGRSVLDLDAEDFEALAPAAGWGPALAACAIPREPRSPRRGALGSLRPLYALMLEVIEARAMRRESTQILVTVHLMGEFLPHLAWESTFGHAVDPAKMRGSVGQKWGTTSKDCPHSSPMRSAAERALTACDEDERTYREYMNRFHSRTGQALTMCAMNTQASVAGQRPAAGTMCAHPCAWATQMPPAERSSLDARIRLARLFQESDLVALRHHAPIGHFFAAPTLGEVRAAWDRTWNQLTEKWPDRGNPLYGRPVDTGFLPGLSTLLSTIAAEPVTASSIVASIAQDVAKLSGE